jgi:hypothetical protein
MVELVYFSVSKWGPIPQGLELCKLGATRP